MRSARDPLAPPHLADGTRPVPLLAADDGLTIYRGGTALAADLARLGVPALLDRLGRPDLEWFVKVCLHLAGEAPRVSFAGLTDDEVRMMALRLRRRLGGDE